MLNDKSREILFWFTIGMIGMVALVAVVTIVRSCGGPIQTAPPLEISPSEAVLCPGASQQFTVAGEGEFTWQATGGTVSANGLFTAGATPGDYAVTAQRTGSRQMVRASVRVVACTPTPPPPRPPLPPRPPPRRSPPRRSPPPCRPPTPRGTWAATRAAPPSRAPPPAWTSAPSA